MAKFIRTELTLNPKVYKKLERKKRNEKVKEHLYYKWKLYVAALGTIVIITSTGLGVSLGVPWHEIFSNLNHLKLNKTAIDGKENMKAEDAFNAVLSNNTKISDLKTNVELSSFTAPSYTTTGSLTIKAKADGKYSGSVNVIINAIGQVNLKDLTGIIKEVANTITKDNALQAFLNANTNKYPDLASNVTFDENSFKAPTYRNTGSYTINATTNGKYSGNINITINAIGQTNLSDLNLDTSAIDGKENMTAEDALNTFLENNNTITDLQGNVETETFTAPSYTTAGSLTIKAKANGKYNGSVKIKITTIKQIKLSDLNLDTSAIDGKENMTAEDALNIFLENNSNISDLKNNVEAGTFTASTYSSTGKLTVNAKPDGKYSGSVNVTINAIKQTNLKDLIGIIKEVASSTTKSNALQAFLNANTNKYPDLAGNVTLDENSFKAPSYTTTGSYTINAKENSKYNGTITISIEAIGQTNLKDLNLDTSDITGTENMKAEDALNTFLANNSTITDLKDNVATGAFTAPSYTSEGKLTINAKANSKYSGSIKIIITKLVTNEQQEIVNSINQASYSIQTKIDSSVKNINNIINTDTFIKEPLNSKIQNAFKMNLFKFNKITIDNKNLQDSDLTTAGTINAKINYDYGSITNQETNITINVFDPGDITDKQIVDAISGMTFDAFAQVSDKSLKQFYKNVFTKDYITGQMNHLSEKIPAEIKDLYDKNKEKFEFITLTFDNGEEITDEYLKSPQSQVKVKFIYNYGSYKNQVVNLWFEVK